MSSLNQSIDSKLEELSLRLRFDSNPFPGIDIKYGISGLIVFSLYYAEYSNKNSFRSNAISLLLDGVNQINSEKIPYRPYEQIGEFGRMIAATAHRFNYYTLISEDLFDVIDEIQTIHLERSFILSDIDFVSGIMGVGQYFLVRLENFGSMKAQDQIVSIVKWLSSNYYSDKNGGIYWKSYLFEKPDVYLGHHGQGAIIIFLSKLIKLGVLEKECRSLLSSAMIFVKNSEYSTAKPNFFPVVIDQEVYPNPVLEWIYGDLGVLYSLYLGAEAINSNQFRKYSLEKLRILAACTNTNSAVVDAGIAHGAMGAYYVFSLLYASNQEDIFKKSSEYWIEQSLSYFKKNADGQVDYSAHFLIHSHEESNLGFISGISGIGSFYVNFLFGKKEKFLGDLLFM